MVDKPWIGVLNSVLTKIIETYSFDILFYFLDSQLFTYTLSYYNIS